MAQKTMIYKTLCINPQIEQHEPHFNWKWTQNTISMKEVSIYINSLLWIFTNTIVSIFTVICSGHQYTSMFWEKSSNIKCIYFRHYSSRWFWFRILPLFLYNFYILLNLFSYSICTKRNDRFNPASMLCLSEARTWIYIHLNVLRKNADFSQMIYEKKMFKQWWSIISLISTKRIITSDLKTLNIKKNNHLWPQQKLFTVLENDWFYIF
jgi:hypothetical protein